MVKIFLRSSAKIGDRNEKGNIPITITVFNDHKEQVNKWSVSFLSQEINNNILAGETAIHPCVVQPEGNLSTLSNGPKNSIIPSGSHVSFVFYVPSNGAVKLDNLEAFTEKTVKPLENPVLKIERNADSYVVSWNNVQNAISYKLEKDRNKFFTVAEQFNIVGNEKKFDAKKGSHYFRVTALGENIKSKHSNIQEVTYL